jgi:hypothetical protein
MECSAKTGENEDQLFIEITKLCRKYKQNDPNTPIQSRKCQIM